MRIDFEQEKGSSRREDRFERIEESCERIGVDWPSWLSSEGRRIVVGIERIDEKGEDRDREREGKEEDRDRFRFDQSRTTVNLLTH